MRSSGDATTTRLSRFGACAGNLLAALAFATACAGPEPTSLDGEIPCDSQRCGAGQLCKEFEPHPGEPLQYTCVSVPDACDVYDCVSDTRSCSDCDACSACVLNLCGYITRVEDRTLICLGY